MLVSYSVDELLNIDECYHLPNDAFISSLGVEDRDAIAEECARDYFYNHDGWELGDNSFDLYLHLNGGVYSFEINIDMEPRFNAYEV